MYAVYVIGWLSSHPLNNVSDGRVVGIFDSVLVLKRFPVRGTVMRELCMSVGDEYTRRNGRLAILNKARGVWWFPTYGADVNNLLNGLQDACGGLDLRSLIT